MLANVTYSGHTKSPRTCSSCRVTYHGIRIVYVVCTLIFSLQLSLPILEKVLSTYSISRMQIGPYKLRTLPGKIKLLYRLVCLSLSYLFASFIPVCRLLVFHSLMNFSTYPSAITQMIPMSQGQTSRSSNGPSTNAGSAPHFAETRIRCPHMRFSMMVGLHQHPSLRLQLQESDETPICSDAHQH